MPDETDRYPTDPLNGPAQMADHLRSLERRIATLEGARPLGNTTLAGGTLRITASGVLIVEDNDGNERVLVGHLGSGAFDVAVTDPADTGTLVRLSTLAYGPSGATVATQQSTTSTSYTDLGTVGPTVTTMIGPSGRAIVLGAARVTPAASDSAGIGVSVDGAAASFLADVADVPGTGVIVSIAGFVALTGLTPGSRQFRMKYRSASGGTAFFSDRSLVVLPF